MGNEASREQPDDSEPEPGHGNTPQTPSLISDVGTKPRLTSEEVDILEQEFAKNPKPDSERKKQLAKQFGIESARINNWFQNRRAKEKQMKHTLNFERRKESAGDAA
ncbi:Homeodomain-like protein [Cercophora scortea]|uniref:Homeodomain-like protein n=1 Tax=Cercophora scortea TaxID=314031 RepID=A0AAE0J7F1_9PEZI|nr:Homeodomain-like protein [Cercophora scortea]